MARQYGLGNFAAAITKDADGRYHAPAGEKQEILNLRKDPDVCALMAGEYAKTTQGQMRASLGRDVCGGELYAAHFLGPDAACRLIKLVGSDPSASAAAQFPQAAAANKSVFYHADGAPKSVREVYDWAMRQPGGEGTVRVAAACRHHARRMRRALKVADRPGCRSADAAAERDELAARRRPGHVRQSVRAQFQSGQELWRQQPAWRQLGGATPSSAMSFGPSLLGILSDAKDGDVLNPCSVMARHDVGVATSSSSAPRPRAHPARRTAPGRSCRWCPAWRACGSPGWR